MLGGDPGPHPVGRPGQVVQGGQHGLVIGPGPAEDLGVGRGQAGLGGLKSPSRLVSAPCSARLRSHITANLTRPSPLRLGNNLLTLRVQSGQRGGPAAGGYRTRDASIPWLPRAGDHRVRRNQPDDGHRAPGSGVAARPKPPAGDRARDAVRVPGERHRRLGARPALLRGQSRPGSARRGSHQPAGGPGDSGAGDRRGRGRGTAGAGIAAADWLFAGPGSPSYALAHWQAGPVAAGLRDRVLAVDGVTVLASAAAATAGRFTVPVYEIYKAAGAARWLTGLGLLGLPVAVIPHYDNAEGGRYETRHATSASGGWPSWSASFRPTPRCSAWTSTPRC